MLKISFLNFRITKRIMVYIQRCALKGYNHNYIAMHLYYGTICRIFCKQMYWSQRQCVFEILNVLYMGDVKLRNSPQWILHCHWGMIKYWATFLALIVVRMPSHFRTNKAQRPCLPLKDINYYLSNFISPPANSLGGPFKCLYSKNAWCLRNDSETHETVLLLDCTTGEVCRVRFTVISHTPMRSRFYHTHIMYKRNWDYFCLVNLIYFALHIFQIRNLIIALINLGEACHLKRRDLVTVWWTMLLLCCYHCECMQQHYDVTQFECVLRRHTMHEWVMNIHYKTWIAHGRFTNIILTPSTQ